MKVDLFLGGPLGLWVLDNVDSRDIGTVYSTMPEITSKAYKLGISGDKGEIGFSMHYSYLLTPEQINSYKVVFNIHPALLPYGRCYYPVFWSLWRNEPTGCTLHIIDEGIDSGSIVAQREVPKYEWDTGGSLHKRVSDAEKALFLEYWPKMIVGRELPTKSQNQLGSFHYKKDFFKMKQQANLENMSAKELIHLIMCLSHDDYTGLEVEIGGRKYHLKAEAM